MSAVTVILIALVALLAGMGGILDEFQFHQPLVACTLIGLVSGHLVAGIILGGTLQMMALGWANIGAAVAPDAALASVASSILMVLALNGGDVSQKAAIDSAIAAAVPLQTVPDEFLQIGTGKAVKLICQPGVDPLPCVRTVGIQQFTHLPNSSLWSSSLYLKISRMISSTADQDTKISARLKMGKLMMDR